MVRDAPVVAAVHTLDEFCQLIFVFSLLSKVDDVHCYVVLLELLTQSHQGLFGVRHWGSHEDNDPLALVLVLTMLEGELARRKSARGARLGQNVGFSEFNITSSCCESAVGQNMTTLTCATLMPVEMSELPAIFVSCSAVKTFPISCVRVTRTSGLMTDVHESEVIPKRAGRPAGSRPQQQRQENAHLLPAIVIKPTVLSALALVLELKTMFTASLCASHRDGV